MRDEHRGLGACVLRNVNTFRTWNLYALNDEGRCYEMRRSHRSRLSQIFFLLSVRRIDTSVGFGCDIRELLLDCSHDIVIARRPRIMMHA